MQYITTTNLRTQTSKLVKTLKENGKVSLIHRSEVIGVIEPIEATQGEPVTLEKLRAFLKAVKPKKLVPKSKRESVYRKRLMEKYGQGLS